MANSDIKSVAHRLVPILGWIPGYRREWLLEAYISNYGRVVEQSATPDAKEELAKDQPLADHAPSEVVTDRDEVCSTKRSGE